MNRIPQAMAELIEIVTLFFAQNGDGANADNSAHAFNPSYPAHGTLTARMLALLLFGQKVSQLNALDTLGAINLGPAIIELCDLGWSLKFDIGTTLNRFNEQIIFSEYTLRPADISAAGGTGVKFAVAECLHNVKVSTS